MHDLLLGILAFICAGLQVMAARVLLRFEGEDYALARSAARPLLLGAACLLIASALSFARSWAS